MFCLHRFLDFSRNFLPDAIILDSIRAVLWFLKAGDISKGDGVSSEDEAVAGVGVVNTRQVISVPQG